MRIILSTVVAYLARFAASHRIVTHDETFVPDAILRVTFENVSQPCVPTKPIALVNGTSPGPALYVEEGKTTWIRVYNDMSDLNLTMHWHGLSMTVSPFSDGTPQASQWPIPPQHFFDYEINVPMGMAGTYYYHSHVGFQAVSVNGPLIVKDRVVPYHYEERIIMFNDVFNRTMASIEAGLVAAPMVWSGETNNILINGKGAGVASGMPCNATLSVIDVEPGKTYRLRFIGGTALTFASFAIEDHDILTVIEADGSYTKPVDVSFMQVTAGQRFSALLRTKHDVRSGQYFMQVESRERPTVTTSYAILNYGPPRKEPAYYPPSEPPLTLPATDQQWLEYKLEPLFPNHFPTRQEVTRRIYVDVQQLAVNGPTTYWANNVTWTESVPTEPYLVSLYKNDGAEYPSLDRALQHGGVDPVTHAWPAEIGEVLEIVLQNLCDNKGVPIGGFDTHPFHAHGLHYYDIGSGNGTYNVDENEKRLRGYNPVQRDTTPLFRYLTQGAAGMRLGWRAWRLRVQEPGVWMIHCHIQEHMLMGMQMVWVMGNSSEVLRLPINDVSGYLTYGGNVNGNASHWPVVVEYNDQWAGEQ